MLKKLLKYDFQSVFKYWWIAALISFVLSFGGGGCIALLNSGKDFPVMINVIAVLILVLVIISYVVSSILSTILVFARFYKNFFTDEGYLTFTLPVKRSALLNSKLILSTVTMLVTCIVCCIDILVMLCVGFAKEVFTSSFWFAVSHFIDSIITELGWYLVLYILAALILIVLATVFSCLFLFACITFASIIAKKARILIAIGIYYVANSIYSFAIQILYIFGISSLSHWLSDLPAGWIHPVVLLLLLGILLFMAMFCALLYTLQYWMIDRRLNLN